MRKTLSSWLTTRYLLIIRSEENFAEKTTITYNRVRLMLLLLLSFTIMLALATFMVTSVMKRWFDPRHAQLEFNKKLINLNITVDSLLDEVNRKEQFINNFQAIMLGEEFSTPEYDNFTADSVRGPGSDAIIAQTGNIDPFDSVFRREFEDSGLELMEVSITKDVDYENLFLFSPISGIISSKFNPQIDHYGVDIVAKKDEPVKCVADGTVVMAGWTQENGYVVAVQHRNNLISVYKHNSDLLKNVGNFVSAGEIISIIGNTGELTTGPHLHFELWLNGNPVDPEEFVSF